MFCLGMKTLIEGEGGSMVGHLTKGAPYIAFVIDTFSTWRSYNSINYSKTLTSPLKALYDVRKLFWVVADIFKL